MNLSIDKWNDNRRNYLKKADLIKTDNTMSRTTDLKKKKVNKILLKNWLRFCNTHPTTNHENPDVLKEFATSALQV